MRKRLVFASGLALFGALALWYRLDASVDVGERSGSAAEVPGKHFAEVREAPARRSDETPGGIATIAPMPAGDLRSDFITPPANRSTARLSPGRESALTRPLSMVLPPGARARDVMPDPTRGVVVVLQGRSAPAGEPPPIALLPPGAGPGDIVVDETNGVAVVHRVQSAPAHQPPPAFVLPPGAHPGNVAHDAAAGTVVVSRD